jgi:very-short-patch-repair endonuclease
VYLVGVAPPDWLGRLDAAVLAAGTGAAASHRAALVLWGLDGIGAAPLEVTVPVTHGPEPAGVIVHRSRRPVAAAVVEGIAVTGVERTLVDAAACLPPVVVEKAMESAVRRNLTTAAKIERYLDDHAGRGVRGTRVLRELMAERPPGRAAGSGAEVELVRLLRDHGLPAPVRQYEIALPGGAVAVVDLAWPELRKVVEVDGLDAHAGAEALDHDDDRQNRLLEAGYELRRYTGRAVRRRPEAVVASISRFLRS